MTDIKRTILIVDDNKESREELKTLILKGIPHVKILEAGSGEEAIDIAMKENPHIAMVDIGLPHMDGLRTAKIIKQCVPECHLITMSVFKNAVHSGFVAAEVVAFIEKREIEGRLIELLDKLFCQCR